MKIYRLFADFSFSNNKKRNLIISGILLVVLILLFVGRCSRTKESQLFSIVKKGDFEILVTVTGEIEAMNKEDITAPQELRSDKVRLNMVKIQDLVPEGTIVDSGQYVATLDRSEITTLLRDVQDELEKQRSSFLKAQLDTTIQQRDLRDQLVNYQSDVEEKQIALDQSKYEPPATIRQAQLNLEKSKRTLENAKTTYQLKIQQCSANMREASINVERELRSLDEIRNVENKFVITAPKKGMVIYAKEWNGQKRKVGSSISQWDPAIATLPDLSVMISRTYVSEIDINKIVVGQKVRVGLDAFPERKFTGRVITVSNIGEQLPNTDSKVFEVVVRLNNTDPTLRPYMTTANTVIINTIKDVIHIPLEAVHNEDSIPFVYKKNDVKQVVMLSHMNDNDIIVEKGLDVGEEIYLSIPEKGDSFDLEGAELIPLILAKEAKKKGKIDEHLIETGEQTQNNINHTSSKL